MRRKQVSRRLGAVAEVRASLAAHRGSIVAQLDERLPSPPAEAVPSYRAYFDHMDHELAQVERRLVAAEDRHVRKLVRVAQLRRRRQELADGVYDKQTSARQILAGLYGSDRNFELAAISGKTPQVTQVLAEQVDQTVKLLRNPEGERPSERIDGVDLRFDTMATDLEGDLKELRGLRVQLERTRKEADATRILTNEAIVEFDRVFPWVAQTLEGLFSLVGEFKLADRIRTSIRRVTRKQGESQEEETSGEPASDGGSATESPASPSAESAEATPPPTAS